MKIPEDWTSRLARVPVPSTNEVIADALGVKYNDVYFRRKKDRDFDTAVSEILGARSKLVYDGPRKKMTLVPYPVEREIDDFLLDMKLASFEDKLIKQALNYVTKLRKDNRRLRSENNRLRTNIHNLRKGGTPVVHASSGSAHQSSI